MGERSTREGWATGGAADTSAPDESRIAAALERIARAAAERAEPTPPRSGASTAQIAERLDALIAELRHAVDQQRE